MNLRILQPFIILCFLLASAFIAADMLNTYSRGAMQMLPSFTMPEKTKKTPVAQSPAEDVEKDIASPSEALPSIKLLGTITGAFPYAVVHDLTTSKQELYKLKSDIGDGWIVYGIEKNKIVLKKGERKEVLDVKFMEAEPKTEVGAGLKPTPTGTGIILDQMDVEAALSDLNKVMTQARVIPNLVDGKTTGYRIFNIASGSIYTKLGLRNNDIVERVNGVEIQNPESLYQLFQQIRNERKIALDYTRGGKKESVNIEIR